MEWIRWFIDLFLHLDVHLKEVVTNYGTWTYLILFVVIFCETGLVVTPFLPGDSLLFAAGACAALGDLNPVWLFLLLSFAAFLGDTTNYWIGHFIGPRAFTSKSRLFKKEHLERTHRFYEKYGGKTIILAQYVPIVRTFAPFVAGIGAMNYPKFMIFNITGVTTWVAIFVFSGYFFGRNEWVQKHFSIIVLVIIFISVTPMIVEYIRFRIESKKEAAEKQAGEKSE